MLKCDDHSQDRGTNTKGETNFMAQQMMKAVLLHGYGDVNRFSYEDVHMPVPAVGEVLAACGAMAHFQRG
jgi:hypothetical protein